jgi:hypothetical protein
VLTLDEDQLDEASSPPHTGDGQRQSAPVEPIVQDGPQTANETETG